MGDLNLDFDMGTKSISIGDTSNDNLGFSKGETDFSPKVNDIINPSLTVSDQSGVELLAKGSVSHVKSEPNSDTGSLNNDGNGQGMRFDFWHKYKGSMTYVFSDFLKVAVMIFIYFDIDNHFCKTK